MADTLSTNLQTLIASKNQWNAPCTFKRLNPMPLDPETCFGRYADLTNYLSNAASTAYPGMFVTVTSCEDPKAGAYVLMSDGTKLNPIKLDGGVRSVSITGAQNEEGEEYTATPDANGNAKIVLDGIQFDEMQVNNLYLAGEDILNLIPNLSNIGQIETVDEVDDEFDTDTLKEKYNELATKFNTLLNALVNSTSKS